MNDKNRTIIALEKTIQSEASGTEPSRHVLIRYGVDLQTQVTVATLGSFMSAKATQPVDVVNVQLKGAPEGVQALYAAILAMPEGPLAGAAAIYAPEAAV